MAVLFRQILFLSSLIFFPSTITASNILQQIDEDHYKKINKISQQKYLKQFYKNSINIVDPKELENLLYSIAQKSKVFNNNESMILLTNKILIKLLDVSKKTSNIKMHSLANGNLGNLYEKQKQIREAISLTQRAILDAQSINDHYLLMLWEWQLARLYKLKMDRSRSIASYRRSVYHLELIRQDIPVTYDDGKSSFRETLSPIYFGLADQLLQEATFIENKAQNNIQKLLREARNTIEKIKISEIQDYLNSKCDIKQSKSIEAVSDDVAVIYPIILDDRLEILVNIGSNLTHYTTEVSKVILNKTAKQLVNTLRPTSNGKLKKFNKDAAKKIYQYLIEPIKDTLSNSKISTLVFIPDGIFREFPIATLWDGKEFLIENYAIATAPGLTLLASKPLYVKKMSALLAGMSKPGPVVDELPQNIKIGLLSTSVSNNRGLRGININRRGLTVVNTTKRKAIIQNKNNIDEKIKTALELPGVHDEIKKLENIVTSDVLFNQNFLLNSFSSKIDLSEYQIIHIASHGFFGGKPEENFIMTYDKKLDTNQLAKILQPRRLSQQPIELLTLSACQTAEGDDRSPLGLSGVALKSGVRSVLGSLWPVSDDAAKKMLPEFYDFLVNTNMSKAKALQSSQKEMIKTKKFEHPFYWSPFVLIGNWI